MKDFCCSSFLAFRYIEKNGMDFFPELKHRNFIPPTEKEKTLVSDENDVDNALSSVFKNLKNEKLGLMLSGGMDSACLASYIMSGCDAYTFRFCNGEFQKEELKRAERFANYYNLKLHYIDINWNDVETYLPIVIEAKNAPVHSIEPQ
ncbi:MAG: asparagine synthase-related protein [Phascolarctobacterium sp.]|nr:asparagine synthase-related protein [Phascolarctobacterium sp.]